MAANQHESSASTPKEQGKYTTLKRTSDIGPNFNFDAWNASQPETTIPVDEVRQSTSGISQPITAFPVEVFPPIIQHIIRATEETLNFPVDFTGTSILYAVALTIGNTNRVEVKAGWTETAVLYIAIVGRAGTNKSHPLTFAIQPILDRDKVTYHQYREQMKEYFAWQKLSKKEKEERGQEEFEEPKHHKFIVSDITPEGLAAVHYNNKRGIGVYVDELAGWFKNFNRYNKGNEQEVWLSNWSGKELIIDRKTAMSVFLPKPFIPVIGTIQPGILNELASDNRSQNGFIDRILFVMPDNLKKNGWRESEMPRTLIASYGQILTNLMEIPITLDSQEEVTPSIIRPTPEAKARLFDWVNNHNTTLCNQPSADDVAGIHSKMEVYVIRLALILQLLRWSCDVDNKDYIGIEAIEGAITLTEYFRAMALKINQIVKHATPLDRLPLNKRTLYDALADVFTTEDGLRIAAVHGVPARTFKRFISKEPELFRRLKQGEYEKLL
ncbi:YfjI family protein [Larkinella terrae]|uniref:DUF3987 domain-containing protein n=1 Tax=Larkinella terrae TaxID=2025311 RepID=A0A7K0ECZ9_9BACT|nr:YfjI family protein [Larkinella terrae]MRS59790.1 DUF3987 domain-containing protein [Larkinella terrae]